jgi:Tfp pilus assembly protein PilN
VRAVNLIPSDARRRTSGRSVAPQGPGLALIGLLAIAVGFVTIYVLTTNTISQRKVQVAQLQAQVAQQHALASKLGTYAQFAKLAQARVATIRQIAATRFDWHAALSDLSKVMPANASLQSLTASVATGGTGGSSGADALRGAITAPAFEMTGCTRTQDDVARLMSRLRLINGVTRVTLGDSQKQGGSQVAAAATTTSSSGSVGCGPNAPTFDLVIFFTPLPGAGASGASTPSPSGTAPAQATPVSNTATTPGQPGGTTSTGATPATATPVHNTTSTGGSK